MLEADGLLKMPFDQLKFMELPLNPNMSQINGIVLSKADVYSSPLREHRKPGKAYVQA